MGKLVMVPWDWDAVCHTHGCYGRIRWRIVPDELQDVTAATVAGLCDECRDSLLAGQQAGEIPPIDWPQVDKFLREHRQDPLARQLVEGALGIPMPEQEAPTVVGRKPRQGSALRDGAKRQ